MLTCQPMRESSLKCSIGLNSEWWIIFILLKCERLINLDVGKFLIVILSMEFRSNNIRRTAEILALNVRNT